MNPYLPLHSTRAAEGLPRRRFTIADVEAMLEAGILDWDERNELIGGELVPMSEKGIEHEVVKAALNDRWCRLLQEICQIAPSTTFRLAEDTYFETAFIVYPRAVGYVNITGPNALLVVEIADSSLDYDRGRKAALYASFGIRELWVIDAVGMKTRAFRSPSPDGYLDVVDHTARERLAPC